MIEKVIDFLEEVEEIDASRIIFVDEAAVNKGMARTHARAPVGQRAYGRKPHNWGPRYSLIGALGFTGLLCAMFWEGYVDKEVFIAFVQEYLVPELKKGDVVIWDNYSVHKGAEIARLIHDAGAVVLFLPPYSPELSPIEECWSKIKNFMKKAEARTKESLFEAFSQAYETISTSDAQGWFNNCGYHAQSN